MKSSILSMLQYVVDRAKRANDIELLCVTESHIIYREYIGSGECVIHEYNGETGEDKTLFTDNITIDLY